MLPFADVLDLFTHKLTGLSGRRLPLPGIFPSSFDRLLFRHFVLSLILQITPRARTRRLSDSDVVGAWRLKFTSRQLRAFGIDHLQT